jgi:hypothetical protein
MKYEMRKVTAMMREIIKVTFRNVVEKWNNVGICIMRSGIIEKTMILAIFLVSTSIVMP